MPLLEQIPIHADKNIHAHARIEGETHWGAGLSVKTMPGARCLRVGPATLTEKHCARMSAGLTTRLGL